MAPPPRNRRASHSAPLPAIDEVGIEVNNAPHESSELVICDVDDKPGTKSKPEASAQETDDEQSPQPEPRVLDTPKISKKELEEEDPKLLEFRAAVMADIGASIKQTCVQTFEEDLLPRLDPAIDIDSVLQSLRAGQDPVLANNGWTAFNKALSASASDKKITMEDKFYLAFAQIVNAIIDTRPSNRQRCLIFEQRPTRSPLCMFKKYTGQPDGYGLLMPSDGVLLPQLRYWNEMVVAAEYKKKRSSSNTNDHNDNVTKLCGDMAQIMRDDPARRFTYGITLEQFLMRIWYCDRSQIVVSESFDVMKDYTSLIRFVLSIAYPQSPWEIGFDTTMPLTIVGDQYYYEISVRDTKDTSLRHFRTLELLDAYGAGALRGRGTRVWKAIEVVDGKASGNPVVLKDTWIDSDRTREGEIMEKLLNDISLLDDRMTVKQYLLTVVCHGDVASPFGVEDTTRLARGDGEFTMRQQARPYQVKQAQTGGSKKNNRGSRSGGPSSNPSWKGSETSGGASKSSSDDPPLRQSFTYSQKTHYRIVFEEVGEPLIDMTSMQDAFHALRHVCSALFFIHQAGWVHRDISSRNVLWVRGRKLGTGKLADLEYAKKEDDETPHTGVQTATDFFVAVEVRERIYRHTMPITDGSSEPATTTSEIDLPHHRSQPDDYPKKPSRTFETGTVPPEILAITPRFRYNRLHDVESLWWLAVYVLFYRAMEFAIRSQDEIRMQQTIAAALFEDMKVRGDVFQVGTLFASYVDHLHVSVRWVGKKLEDLRARLMEAYMDAENLRQYGTLYIDPLKLSGLLTTFRRVLREIILNAGGFLLSPHVRLVKGDQPLGVYIERNMISRNTPASSTASVTKRLRRGANLDTDRTSNSDASNTDIPSAKRQKR